MTAGNRTEILAAATDALTRGWRVIPVPYRSKKVTRTEWQQERWDADQLPGVFSDDPTNIGLLTGQPSGGLVDIDVDCARALAIARLTLPETGTVFGRPGAPASHLLYTVPD